MLWWTWQQQLSAQDSFWPVQCRCSEREVFPSKFHWLQSAVPRQSPAELPACFGCPGKHRRLLPSVGGGFRRSSQSGCRPPRMSGRRFSRRRYTFSPPIRTKGSAARQSIWSRGRNCTATEALRLASPRISHSNPRFSSVGCSTVNVPASVRLFASAPAIANTQQQR